MDIDGWSDDEESFDETEADPDLGDDGTSELEFGGDDFDYDETGLDIDGDDLDDDDADDVDAIGDGEEDVDEPETATWQIIDEQAVGTDADTAELAAFDEADAGPDFPPALDIDPRPEPVDGPPWSDADLLGRPDGDTAAGDWDAVDDHSPVDDLLAFDASTDSADAWNSLLSSDDPAVSGLARWWQS